MIRAVLDTNVLASGFVGFADAARAPAQLLRLWRDQQFELVVSPHIVTEFINTVDGSYVRRRLTPEQIAEAQRLLQEEATSTPLTITVSGAATHPEDDLVLAAAVSAQVDFLVTGDTKLQRLGGYQGVRILSPRAFLDLLESSAEGEPRAILD